MQPNALLIRQKNIVVKSECYNKNLKLLQMQTKSRQIISATILERRVTMLIDAPTLVINLSSSKPRKRRKCIWKIEDGYDPNLDGNYVEDWFPKDRSHD
jgi:hypothetical protein